MKWNKKINLDWEQISFILAGVFLLIGAGIYFYNTDINNHILKGVGCLLWAIWWIKNAIKPKSEGPSIAPYGNPHYKTTKKSPK
jgi:uncharacterized membrane protein YfcA